MIATWNSSNYSSVHTTRVHGPCPRASLCTRASKMTPVSTGREHGRGDGCQKMTPVGHGESRITARRHGCQKVTHVCTVGWLRGPAVEHRSLLYRSLAGVLSLSCARPVADGCPLTWVSHPLYIVSTNQANSAFHPFGVDKWVVKLQLDICCISCGGAVWWTLTKERRAWCCLQVKLCDPCLSALRVRVRTKMALYKYSSFLAVINNWTISSHDTNQPR